MTSIDSQADTERQLFEEKYSVPKEDAVGYVEIGVDLSCEPLPDGEGYWIPVGDKELVEIDYPPRGHIIQYPKDELDPHRVGEGLEVPDWVVSWDYRGDADE